MSPRTIVLAFGAALLVVFGGVAWISAVALRLDHAALEARRQAAIDENVRLALWRLDSALLPLIARENARSPADYLPGRDRPEHVRQLFELQPDGAMGTLQAQEILAVLATSGPPAASPTPTDRSDTEWQLRNASLEGCSQAVGFSGAPLTPVWVHGELLLVRRAGERSVQGAWLDWQELQRWLPGTVADLLPGARVEPASPQDEKQRRLAALPVRLIPGEVRLDPERSSVGLVLAIAWAGLLLAVAAVIALLAGTLSLSERRAIFVSAVTHELRTPMTTLQTYSEMLVDGKITDPARRQHYLEILHREAVRLAHLVNNVLAYSGIERGRRAVDLAPLPLGPLLEGARERLTARAAEAGMTLEVACDEALKVQGDPGPIEQILFNLVDNAAKYGAVRVSISAVRRGSSVELRVRDEGSGVRPDVRGRLFEPFSKSAEKAAGGVPGVGLGLALSRSLARAMGGDLRLAPGPGGACFVVTLRQA